MEDFNGMGATVPTPRDCCWLTPGHRWRAPGCCVFRCRTCCGREGATRDIWHVNVLYQNSSCLVWSHITRQIDASLWVSVDDVLLCRPLPLLNASHSPMLLRDGMGCMRGIASTGEMPTHDAVLATCMPVGCRGAIVSPSSMPARCGVSLVLTSVRGLPFGEGPDVDGRNHLGFCHCTYIQIRIRMVSLLGHFHTLLVTVKRTDAAILNKNGHQSWVWVQRTFAVLPVSYQYVRWVVGSITSCQPPTSRSVQAGIGASSWRKWSQLNQPLLL